LTLIYRVVECDIRVARSAYSTSGHQSLTSGQAITMVDQNNRTLAEPVKLNDSAFRALFIAA
jgi:hypothetical protein